MAYSFLDLACDVLQTAKQPLTYQEIWETAKTSGLSDKIKTSGKTPWQTLGARLCVDVRDDEEFEIHRSRQKTGQLLSQEPTVRDLSPLVSKMEKQEETEVAVVPKYKDTLNMRMITLSLSPCLIERSRVICGNMIT